MKTYEIIQIGTHHTNYCEDYVIQVNVGDGKLLCAVMDGCTMATESYFASTLIGKILRKIAEEISYRSFIEKREKETGELLEEILKRLFFELKDVKNYLFLKTHELLSTLLISVIDIENRKGELLVVGDGVYYLNGEMVEFEQNNKPDYLGYHLAEEFDEWLAQQNQRATLEQIQDLSISTDGVFTFQKFDNKEYPESENVIDFLFKDQQGVENTNMLKSKLYEIEQRWGLKPTDDIGIIRIIF